MVCRSSRCTLKTWNPKKKSKVFLCWAPAQIQMHDVRLLKARLLEKGLSSSGPCKTATWFPSPSTSALWNLSTNHHVLMKEFWLRKNASTLMKTMSTTLVIFFFENSIPAHNALWLYTAPTPYLQLLLDSHDTLPPSCPLIYFFPFRLWLTVSSWCCLCEHGCWTMHWSMGNLQEATPRKKNDSPSPSSHRLQ